jgi:serine/threonine protein kinase
MAHYINACPETLQLTVSFILFHIGWRLKWSRAKHTVLKLTFGTSHCYRIRLTINYIPLTTLFISQSWSGRSTGCTVIEMFTGQRPWLELNQLAALYNLGHYKKPPLPENITDQARDFLEMCLTVYVK